jgi:hypothetical protein
MPAAKATTSSAKAASAKPPIAATPAAVSSPSKSKPRNITLKAKVKLSTKTAELENAIAIYNYSYASAKSLIDAFNDAKAKRGDKRGVLTDQEQDILRAALVMACAGIDASVKQAIRDCFERLFKLNEETHKDFQGFIQKRLAGDADSDISAVGRKFLSKVLIEDNPRKMLVEEYIKHLTGDSLQSFEQLMKTSAALGLDIRKRLNDRKSVLNDIFTTRNKIIHELDIDLEARARKRRVRSQAQLVKDIESVLTTTELFLMEIEKSLTA